MKRFLVCLLVLCMASVASASLIVNVKAVSSPISGAQISEDGKTVTLQEGSTGLVHFEVYALPGACGVTDGLTSMNISVITNDDFSGYYPTIVKQAPTYKVTGNLGSGLRNSAWDAVSGTNVNGASQDITLASTTTGATTISADGMLDLGSNVTTSASGWIQLAADVAPAMDPPAEGFLVYSFDMDVTAATAANDNATLVDAKIRNQANGAAWKENGAVVAFAKNGTNWKSAGPVNLTVAVVPEPATLILLGMGALAMLLFRRRK